jgi:hypothetical protein
MLFDMCVCFFIYIGMREMTSARVLFTSWWAIGIYMMIITALIVILVVLVTTHSVLISFPVKPNFIMLEFELVQGVEFAAKASTNMAAGLDGSFVLNAPNNTTGPAMIVLYIDSFQSDKITGPIGFAQNVFSNKQTQFAIYNEETSKGSVDFYDMVDNKLVLVSTVQDQQPIDNGYFGNFVTFVTISLNELIYIAYNHSTAIGAGQGGGLIEYRRINKDISPRGHIITAKDGNKDDFFGISAHFFEYNNIHEELLVGAPGTQDKDGHVVGAVYRMIRNDKGLWEQSQKLIQKDMALGSEFGMQCVVASGGLVAVISAPNDSYTTATSTLLFTGSITFLTRSTHTSKWKLSHKIYSVVPTTGGRFGISLSVFHDLIIVGEPGRDSGFVHFYQQSIDFQHLRYIDSMSISSYYGPAKFGSSHISNDSGIIVGAPSWGSGGIFKINKF